MAPRLKHPSLVRFADNRPIDADPSTYYGGGDTYTRARTYSESHIYGYTPVPKRRPSFEGVQHFRSRHLSLDERSVTSPRRFLVHVKETIRVLLEQEDTDKDSKFTIADTGPKMIALPTANSNGFKTSDVRGTYMLSSLLQELALAQDHHRQYVILDEARLNENPVQRLSRMIKDSFWPNLTRRLDGDGLEDIAKDLKDWTGHNNQIIQIYVPHSEPTMVEYYRKVASDKPRLKLDVHILPERPADPVFVKSLYNRPGILAMAMNEIEDPKGGKTLEGIPFIVPGARFNEMYYWDSYFIALGLLEDGQITLAKGIIDHFIFAIKHYGKILNGNRLQAT